MGLLLGCQGCVYVTGLQHSFVLVSSMRERDPPFHISLGSAVLRCSNLRTEDFFFLQLSEKLYRVLDFSCNILRVSLISLNNVQQYTIMLNIAVQVCSVLGSKWGESVDESPAMG